MQVGTFTAGTPTSERYSLDVQQLPIVGATFDLMIEYGEADVYSFCRSGFSLSSNGQKYINNERAAAGASHGMWGDEAEPIGGYYATFCAYNGGCGSSGRDFWAFSTSGVYPAGASKVPCGFYYSNSWKDCPSGDNAHRMRYYIRLPEST